MRHLFLLTIGPVQSFIAQARKTMDLKAGSDMLSQLILAGIKTARNDYGANLIFPYLPQEEQPESMPNKFLAEVAINPADVKAMGEVVERQVREYFSRMAKDALKNMKLQNSSEAFRKKFYEQITSHLEVYWVFEAVKGEDDYRRAYQRTEQNLGAIKNIRSFKQLPPDEDGRKCSVSGERDALVFSGANDHLPAFVISGKRERIDKVGTQSAEYPVGISNSNTILLSQGEGLSAVVATKRFFSNASFSSTADVALFNFFTEIENKGGSDKLNNLKWWDTNRVSDGQIFYPENHREAYLIKQGYPPNLAGQVDQIRKAYKELLDFARDNDVSRPSSYYALLTFDGDRMGATWTGDKAYLKPDASLKIFQKDLAKYLFYFAQKARVALDDGKGQTIYAGGDDFTGFVNLHYLFEVLDELRLLYHTEVHDKLKDYLVEDAVLSFSAGVCIAHYKTPLGEVVRYAHKAQDFAKDEEGGNRNALAFYLMKRSGEIQRAAIKWGDNLENLKAIETCTKLMQEGCFSNTFIAVLHDEIMGLVGREKGGSIPFEDFDLIIKQEIKRLVSRSKIEKGIKEYLIAHQDKTEKKLIETMQNSILKLFEFKRENDVENFLHWLEIADFLNRQPDQNAN